MTKARHTITIFITALMMCLFCMLLTSCGKSIDIDTSGMLLVIYDGNGGYLGTKTATARKLYTHPGSKIPDYPMDYATSQYTVPSLGLAMRDGYQLLGWYANADYTLNPEGDYLFLKQADGNGIYELSAEGTFVKKYILRENGTYVYIFLEEPAEAEEGEEPAENTYVFLKNDPEAPEEEQFAPSNGTGFYICNGDATFTEIDDDALRAAYEKAYEAKIYSEGEAKANSGYLIFDDLTPEFKELYDGVDRYEFTFGEAAEEDAELDHYHINDGYIYIYSLFLEDEKGAFVEENGQFVKATAESTGQRYSLNENCIFAADTTAGMDRYDGAMEYWDFASDRVTEDICTKEGEGEEALYVLTLYAHWQKKAAVNFHYNNGTGQVDVMTQYLLADNITYTAIAPGKVIGKKEIIPGFAGHTFVGWSQSEEEYIPWDFVNGLYPEGETELDLYAYYVEGEFTRINSATTLNKIGSNPAGNYLILGDFDLDGKELSASVFGLTEETPFTGKIYGFGSTITNFTYAVKAKNSQVGNSSKIGCALVPYAGDGAVISGLTVEGNVTMTGLTKSTLDMVTHINLYASGIVGTAEGDVLVEDCHAKLTVEPKKDTALKSEAYIYDIALGDVVAYGKVKAEGCTAEIDGSALKGNIKISENKLSD